MENENMSPLFDTYNLLKGQIPLKLFDSLREKALNEILNRKYLDEKRDTTELDNVIFGVLAGLLQSEIDGKK